MNRRFLGGLALLAVLLFGAYVVVDELWWRYGPVPRSAWEEQHAGPYAPESTWVRVK